MRAEQRQTSAALHRPEDALVNQEVNATSFTTIIGTALAVTPSAPPSPAPSPTPCLSSECLQSSNALSQAMGDSGALIAGVVVSAVVAACTIAALCYIGSKCVQKTRRRSDSTRLAIQRGNELMKARAGMQVPVVQLQTAKSSGDLPAPRRGSHPKTIERRGSNPNTIERRGSHPNTGASLEFHASAEQDEKAI